MGRRKSNLTYLLGAVLALAARFVWPPAATADTGTEPAETGKTFSERLSVEARVLTYGTLQEPADSSQNPGNNFLGIPRYLGDLELRPDLRFDAEPLELMAKPRMRLEYSSRGRNGRIGLG